MKAFKTKLENKIKNFDQKVDATLEKSKLYAMDLVRKTQGEVKELVKLANEKIDEMKNEMSNEKENMYNSINNKFEEEIAKLKEKNIEFEENFNNLKNEIEKIRNKLTSLSSSILNQKKDSDEIIEDFLIEKMEKRFQYY